MRTKMKKPRLSDPADGGRPREVGKKGGYIERDKNNTLGGMEDLGKKPGKALLPASPPVKE